VSRPEIIYNPLEKDENVPKPVERASFLDPAVMYLLILLIAMLLGIFYG